MNNIVKHDGRAAAQAVPIRDVNDLLDLGRILSISGFFKNTQGEEQAAAKILAGMELGISPVASLRGLYIVEGQISLAYPLIGALIKKSGKYDYRIREHTAETCVIEFFENGESVGFSALTMKQAKERGLDSYGGGKVKEPWKKFPENMLLSKCLSNGAKAYTSEIFFGSVYTPDELGAEVDGETGVVVEVEEVPGVQLIACEYEGYNDDGGCDGFIRDYTNEQGRTMSAAKIAERTREKYGRPLCWHCAQQAKKAAEQAEEGKAAAVTVAAKSDAKKNLEDARVAYEGATAAARLLGLIHGHTVKYRSWDASRLISETEQLVQTIQDAISSAATQDNQFIVQEGQLPAEDAPLDEWLAVVAAWELLDVIKADNQEEPEMSKEEMAEEVPY